MSSSTASYDQLVRQVEDLRKENTHLRRELEDNSTHLSKLENETSSMKEGLKQLQCKLEQEARSMASSGRTDTLDQLRELQMDLTHYYELKYQPHNLRALSDGQQARANEGADRLPLPASVTGRDRSPLRPPVTHQGSSVSGEGTAVHPGPPHLLEGAEGRVTAQHLEELLKERTLLLREIEREERERCWYYAQLQALSRRLAELPRIDTFSVQIDLIRQQLEFEAQQLRSVMEERFGTSDEMVQRTQIRVARLEQLEKELQDVQDPEERSTPSESHGGVRGGTNGGGKTEAENASLSSVAEVPGDTGSKVEMVFWLLSMLATRDREEMTRTLLAMSSSQDSCLAMRKSGCVPLLVQILHDGPGGAGEAAGGTGCSSREARSRAGAALHNVVYSQPDEGQARREMRVLHVLEQIRTHCDTGWDWIENHLGTPSPGGNKTTAIPEPLEPQICQAMCAIMKLSFEEEYRRAMNELGGLQAVAELIQLDQELYGMQNDPLNMALRRYAGMALTNLTFGDVVNKATLCSRRGALQAVVAQLASDSEELHQVVSSILRNLSWRADINSKKALRDVGSVAALMNCALQATKESTLKSLLSALWNLSAHSTENKEAICSVDGALGFLVSTLTYRCQTNQLAVMESGGGILRNVSSLIATREDYRQVLRDHNCLQILLQHLRSHSLTIVSNACGTLWNLSARSPVDQELLWDLGAVSMLRNLIHSKHKMIAMGSAAALRNLLTNRPLKYKDAAVVSPGSCAPSLYMRKQKALEAELDAKHLAETFESIEKRSAKHPRLIKPLRQIESLAKDYASDSGCCFEDDEATNASVSLDTGSFSMLSVFFNNPNVPPGRPCKRGSDPERDAALQPDHAETAAPDGYRDGDASALAEKLAKKTARTPSKMDRLMDDAMVHTSSEDSFSLSSEDHLVDCHYGADESHEARAKSCSPCRLWDSGSFKQRERVNNNHALMRLKKEHTSLSTDSLNSGSGSASDGYCGSKDKIQPSSGSGNIQKRPDKLDLKEALYSDPRKEQRCVPNNTFDVELPERDSEESKGEQTPIVCGTDEKSQETPQPTPSAVSDKAPAEANTPTIKLSPSYQHVPFIQSMAKFGVGKNSIDVQAPQSLRRQAWVPTVLTGGSMSKLSPASCTWSPSLGQMETLQRYSVENTPICFSRCSSLSSLSSADGAVDGQSQSQIENELDSDASLEIIEVEEGDLVKREEGDDTLEDLSESQSLVTDRKTCESSSSGAGPASQPVEIPCPIKREKVFLRQEDRTPSSPSENCIHESPLVLSRCSSVSSLGSFESPSIASSIQSDPCSEMISGTVSPSDLPDSPGQTMPPSRSKTPCCPADQGGQETQAAGLMGPQWESSWRKFAEIADFRERFNLPPDLDNMIYFTVEKPTENFSCASSLSALPLHEHYVQKDVELKLTPLLHQRGGNNSWDEQGREHPSVLDMETQAERYSEGNSDDDIEILKECISSAMPTRFNKTRTSFMSGIPRQVLNSRARMSTQLPIYMLLPSQTIQKCPGGRPGMQEKDFYQDDSSFTDSAEGTPMNISSTTSLSGETQRSKERSPLRLDNREPVDEDAKRIEDLRKFSRYHRPAGMMGQTLMMNNQMNRVIRRVMPAQRIQMGGQQTAATMSQVRGRLNHLVQRHDLSQPRNGPLVSLPVIKQSTQPCQNQKALQQQQFAQRNLTFQTRRQIPPIDELVCCSCGDHTDANEEGKMTNREGVTTNTGSKNVVTQRVSNANKVQMAHNSFAGKIKHSNETPSRHSLSSSLRSLNDVNLDENQGKVWTRSRHYMTSTYTRSSAKLPNNHNQYERESSPSSVSLDSEDDLLQKCITSAMPAQRKRHSTRKRKTDRRQKPKSDAQKNFDSWDSDRDLRSDEMPSDKDSDLNSVEWRAIQEGAHSIVMRLQAVSKSQEPSSESESTLSLMSGMSAGSSLNTKQEKGNKKKTGKGQNNKGTKFTEGRNIGKPLDFSQRKPVPNMPMIFRGRTVIYTPKKETPSQRPPPKKVPSKTETPPKNPNLAQHRSKSLHRLGQPSDTSEFYLPKRSSTPPARIPKSSSSGSSSNSTLLKQSQKKPSSPSPTDKPIQKKATKVAKDTCNQKETTSTSSAQRLANSKPPVERKTHKSPVRIPFMQNSTRPPAPSRTISPLVTNQPSGISRQNTELSGKQTPPASRLGLVRMATARSSRSDSDRNGFLRQLTFIKESPNASRREVPGSRSVPTSQCASPRRARQNAPAVFLCSSRCQELKASTQGQQKTQVRDQGQRQMRGQVPEQGVLRRGPGLSRTSSSDRDLSVKRPVRRAGSESPCRLPQVEAPRNRPRENETFKRYSSSPSINVLNRTTSRSSMRSSSSDSSGRARSEAGGTRGQQPGSRADDRVTWRRIRDEDVPHILRSTLPSTALPLVPSPDGQNPPLPGKLPTIPSPSRKTSDATVQTEDLSNNKTNSSTSPTLEKAPVTSGEKAKAALLKRISLTSGSSVQVQEGDLDGSLKIPASTSHLVEGHSGGGVGHFRQSCPSKAVIVTPFNYIPSSTTAGSQDNQARAPKLSQKSEEELQPQ
ncbi:adenomatous polyposis coli protein 2-like [Megalops cyprinoides]|uniref:adenomatous polyposis coli protein 2-like n=1 Tax=Megalops cyprinoides TaxID=118141 RepID=UPI001863E04D|nr:adenomatous polyposis coli protein 2-like [Megalops cyprinoides]